MSCLIDRQPLFVSGELTQNPNGALDGHLEKDRSSSALLFNSDRGNAEAGVQTFVIDDAMLIEQATSDKGELLQDFVLERLRFATMKDREEEVAAAHDHTFAWLLDPQLLQDENKQNHESILKWLKRDGASIYWITGKPGSGKSTLMRYMYDHRETRRALATWADHKRLTTAAFFFWISGTEEQRSQTGLLRYLLHQLLDQHRETLPFVFPELWAQLWNATTQERIRMTWNWQAPQLVTGLKLFLSRVESKTNVALFIDGLDELDGDHTEMTKLLQDIVETFGDYVKLCVSSRPWQIFADAFSSVPNLKLQELTLQDMAHYVDDKLLNEPRVRRLVRKDPESARKLKSMIVARASGVFLWVTLAVRLLLDGLKPGDTSADLEGRVRSIPSDLDKLFRHILFLVLTPEQLLDASRILQIVRAREVVCDATRDHSSASLTLWELSLASEADGDFALSAPIQEADDEIAVGRCTSMAKRLTDSCIGFLSIHDKAPTKDEVGLRFANEDTSSSRYRLANSRIVYVHRTARDFLLYSGEWQRLLNVTSKAGFEPHVCHLRACTLYLKLPLQKPQRHRRLVERWSTVVLAMTHARFVIEDLHLAESYSLLDEFNLTMDDLWLDRGPYEEDSWARTAFGTYEGRNKNKTRFHDPFVSLATKFGLHEYVRSKLVNGLVEYKSGTPLLSYVTEYLVSRQMSVYPLSLPRFVATILEDGADPNAVYDGIGVKGETPWKSTLKSIRQAHRRGWIQSFDIEDQGVQRWTEIVKLFIQHGADPKVVLEATHKDKEMTALELFTLLGSHYGSRPMCDIRDSLVE